MSDNLSSIFKNSKPTQAKASPLIKSNLDEDNTDNISEAFQGQKVNLGLDRSLNKPAEHASSSPQTPPHFVPSYVKRMEAEAAQAEVTAPASNKQETPKSLIPNFQDHTVYKDPRLSKRNARFKIMQDLKGSFKQFATRKAIADALINTKVLTKAKVRNRLRKLENQGTLSHDQAKAARKKNGNILLK